MDRFAEQYNGLTPIVVVVNQLPSSSKNPPCSDTENGAVATYLEYDVPAWLKEYFQVDTQSQSRAAGRLSNGGTCAIRILSRKGGPYRIVLDMSGEEFPSLHNLETTIDKGLGGDKATFKESNPLSIFSSGEDFAGYFAFYFIGDKEPRNIVKGLWKVCQAGCSQGVNVQEHTYSGMYEQRVWEKSLDDKLPWSTVKMNLIRTPSH